VTVKRAAAAPKSAKKAVLPLPELREQVRGQ
jgi:hypothetical protein